MEALNILSVHKTFVLKHLQINQICYFKILRNADTYCPYVCSFSMLLPTASVVWTNTSAEIADWLSQHPYIAINGIFKDQRDVARYLMVRAALFQVNQEGF